VDALGRALRQVHEIEVPPSLQASLRREDFSPKGCNVVRSLYTQTILSSLSDETSFNLWNFLQKDKSTIQRLVDRTEQLSQKVRNQPLNFVLCHADIHAGNILIDDTNAFYIVDWDDPMLAPKERDLMFIGAGVGNVWNKPYEEKLFYQGYEQTKIDWSLLAYYRYERIVQDIAEYVQELLLKSTGENRSKMYNQFMDMFETNGVIDIAIQTDKHAVE
jgi:spectinomycin phosphotransferase